MRSTLILLAFLFIAQIGYAQQDAMFTKYMFNSLVFNPAYAGSHEYMSVRLLHRDQWWGIDGSPTTQSFTIHTPASERVGLGLSLVNDKIGSTGSTSANISYAYRFKMGPGKLSIGLQGGVMNWRANYNDLLYRDPQNLDPTFSNINSNQWLPNFGAGIYYYAKHFYVGVSVPHLINTEFKRTINVVPENDLLDIARLYRHYYFTAGAAIPLNGDALIFKPSLLVKSVGLFSNFVDNSTAITNIGAPTEFDIDVSLLFYNTLWVGTSFRSSIEKFIDNRSSFDSADIWASVQLTNGLRIGASYDYTLTKLQPFAKGSFEVMLGYDFQYQVKQVNTPRYF